MERVVKIISYIAMMVAMISVSAVDDPVYGMWMLAIFAVCCIWLYGVACVYSRR